MMQTQSFSETSAMAVKRSKPDVTRFHCAKPGHVKANCFWLIGFPPNFKFSKSKVGSGSFFANSKQASAQQVTGKCSVVVDNIPKLNLSKEQVNKLMSLLNDQANITVPNPISFSSPNQNVSQVNTVGICSYILSAVSHSIFHKILLTDFIQPPWIVDSGATDHIICNSSLFHTFVSVSDSFVSLPNGVKVQVTVVGPFIMDNDWIG
ncbi:hypothetical protein GH714_011330 [Hevea brasiliensis]|uniref:Retrovirus-related Pol polyprotein from transposon TNT 1-94-like beta-barrel domain-containing protein n=1 Tax=Hevea brasiliensis TaxID=3981 RepID=A0A6A6KBC6_HEVBR|nr:hypothetical protein GH714_011262 [Hevea brasiliensis]KAF2286177.1 hypothetical protein GH714_011330 [Hevea brasiliensis]